MDRSRKKLTPSEMLALASRQSKARLQRLQDQSQSDGPLGSSSRLSNNTSRANRTAPSLSTSSLSTTLEGRSTSSILVSHTVEPEKAVAVEPLSSSTNQLPPTAPRSRHPYYRPKEATPHSSPPKPAHASVSRRSKSAAESHRPVDASTKDLVPAAMLASTSSRSSRLIVAHREYSILQLLASGGSAKVYTAVESSSQQIRAIKVVDLGDNSEMKEAYLNEIRLLESLQGNLHVVVLYDYEVRDEKLYVVLEKGETDFKSYLKSRIDAKDVSPTLVKFFWSELLNCVKVIHDKNVLHADLKPANFLFVNGRLKLIDFGIASAIPKDQTSVIKENLMGTLSYMSPEQLQPDVMDHNCSGVYKLPLKSDVWSLGCILYYMVYGVLPFNNFNNLNMKSAAICNPNYEIPFDECNDPDLLDTMKKCLERDVSKRADVDSLLRHPYLCGRAAKDPSFESPMLAKKDMLELAQELKENTPNTMAKKLEKLILRSRSRDAVRTTLNFE